MHKRDFLKSMALSGIALPFSFEKLFAHTNLRSQESLLIDDEFWAGLRNKYQLKPDYINLENGYYNLMPQPILEFFIQQVQILNFEASFYKRTKMMDDKMLVRQILAQFVGCEMEEVIVTRNTTEGMDTVISGIDWKIGDEAIMAEQDYGAMLDMFKQQSKRYGMINKVISIPNHPKSDEEIVSIYENAITKNTKLIMLSHMINISGQILPVRKICDMAHSKGVKVLVDGAHAIAQFEFKLSDLNCDFYASSLHKWLSVPLGAGLLYVKKNNIEALWPIFGDSGYAADDIRKLNHTGTHPMHTEITIPYAIKFYQSIGANKKEERLRFLKDYWVNKVKNNSNIILNTPFESERSCAIANVGIKNMLPSVMAETLLKKYKIWTVAINYGNIQGCRITPNIYTTTKELDQLVIALNEMSDKN